MAKTNHKRVGQNLAPRSSRLAPRSAFTLVELLVVITIISILAALIVVAAVGALKKSQETRIKAEVNEISNAFEEYKNKTTAYPPNCQYDRNAILDSAGVLTDVRRHMQQIAASRTQEPDDLAKVLTGQTASDTASFKTPLAGGMSAGEAVVFWLGGFSSDPKFPISNDGGPSYAIPGPNVTGNGSLDPIASRVSRMIYPFDVSRLGPRNASGYFDDTTIKPGRFIEYSVTINGKAEWRRINFWQYTPAKSEQPFLYFDTSRHPAYDVSQAGTLHARYDPPAATAASGLGPGGGAMLVHAFKKQNATWTVANAATTAPFTFVSPDKFQVMHCGIDGVWDTDTFTAFEQMSADNGSGTKPSDFLLFPTGPYVGEVADTIVNFNTETRVEDSVK